MADDNFPSLDNPWAKPEFWMGDQQQQPQQTQVQQPPKPQLVMGAVDESNPLNLPKDHETLQRMIRQEAMGVVGGLVQQANTGNQVISQLRDRFQKSPEHRPWTDVVEQIARSHMNEGVSAPVAAQKAVEHIALLARSGVPAPQLPKQAIPTGNGYGMMMGNQLASSALRGDENGSAINTIYSDEDRLKDRESWIKDRQKHYAFMRSEGRMGKHLRESNPEAYNQ